MKPGDLIRNTNCKSGEVGIFMGMRTFKHPSSLARQENSEKDKHYTCAEIYWPHRPKSRAVGTVQTNLVEVICECD